MFINLLWKQLKISISSNGKCHVRNLNIEKKGTVDKIHTFEAKLGMAITWCSGIKVPLNLRSRFDLVKLGFLYGRLGFKYCILNIICEPWPISIPGGEGDSEGVDKFKDDKEDILIEFLANCDRRWCKLHIQYSLGLGSVTWYTFLPSASFKKSWG